MKHVQVPVIISLLLITMGLFAQVGSAQKRNGGTLQEISWSGAVNLTENLTIEGDQRLVIAEGTNISFGLDVFLTIEGEIDCGSSDGRTVNFVNLQERLSGGVVLINCPGAYFINTRFTGLAMAVESIYSTLEMERSDFNNTGIGIFCFESRLRLRDTDFNHCDMAGRFIRSNVMVSNCSFTDNLQSLMIHNELEMIGSYYRYEIAEIEKLHEPLGVGVGMTYEIHRCRFSRTGIGISTIASDRIYINRTSFSLCKKGIHGESTPGLITNCSFERNKMDYEITGRSLEVLYSIAPSVNFTIYRYYDITVRDDEGKAVSDTELRISHPDLVNLTYRTDENGSVWNIPLLFRRSVDGTITRYSGYNVTFKNGKFEGYYSLGDEEDILITPSDMISEEGEELIPVNREAGLVLAGIAVILVVVIIVRKSSKKGKNGG